MKFSDISYNIWLEITKELNMFDLLKLSHINPFFYNFCNQNELWEVHYNKLFDRRVITSNAKHIGHVTWYNCRCVSYPGWSKIHEPINNDNYICRKLDHYDNIENKKLKKKFKSYKEQTKKRYIYLLKNDLLTQNYHVIKYEKLKTENEIRKLSDKLNNVNHCLNDINIIHSIIS